MKFQDEIKFISNRNRNRSNFLLTSVMTVLITILLSSFIIVSSTLSVRTAIAALPGVQPGNATTTIGSNTSALASTNATAAIPKPVDGYNTPVGHLSAIRHVFDYPALRIQHYCKPNDKIVLVCQLYDSDSKNATLMGVEYIITAEQYNSLPNREKPNWHLHKIEFVPNRADPMFPDLPKAKVTALMGKLMNTYGKVIITWNPKDKLPAFPPQAEQVQHPYMVNATVRPEIHGGSFNQTLKY
jgi:Protein of unknown function (DUF1264)